MSMTSALISVVSAIAISFAIRFVLCAAQRFTYSARTTVGPVGCCARAGETGGIDAQHASARCVVVMRGTVVGLR